MKNSLQHIPFSQLADLVEGFLPPDEQTKIRSHIATCDRCANELSKLQHLVELMRTDASEDAPSYLISRVIALFRSKAEMHQHVFAIPRFDSKGLSPAFGVRSGEPGARQLLFSADPYDIDLRIEADGQAWIVSGQVLGEAIANGYAELQSATDTKVAALNELCEFTLPPAASGQYKLSFYLPNIDIEVNDLKVGV